MDESAIKNVWRDNLEDEMAKIRNLINRYKYVSMDTEFPGVVAKPMGNFKTTSSYTYQQLRINVDLLKLIQLGITLSDSDGNKPSPVCTWQFNFEFNLEKDMYSQESIDLLIDAKIDFKKHEMYGISVEEFGELLITSGVVMSEEIIWISFHSSYDFGYLTKILTGNPLPENEEGFFQYLKALFPNFYDMKYLMRTSKYLKNGLQEIADDMKIERLGTQHQAGSDSLLTCFTFFRSRDNMFNGNIDESKNLCRLFGIESKKYLDL
ncbi:subunit 8 of CCR4-NOT transcription complex [Hamiltosporidium tvaerminnensis]|uniref:poly(A)-specific ribonuclease n=2 Tax=Hamiltosporidium TaxID=1176354 RepID=A0A4Q9LR93_9MICR|nr:subunit 8 of CCR4-NOT transcription complex [Hamiltosporidium magnivora]TBU05252.1 subunit 8 of CCR4-NOT transcription complex [Hamiltosporidium tvaerminnensis]TBU10914.1 subunit 8 of CCR4-NOT transcription complex [Hamiltosporidium tvaerminnensis]TBU19833.1 subunit 8 of CCR4-NOT transcription complex [Hamiltosporidium tvaerminnensis]